MIPIFLVSINLCACGGAEPGNRKTENKLGSCVLGKSNETDKGLRERAGWWCAQPFLSLYSSGGWETHKQTNTSGMKEVRCWSGEGYRECQGWWDAVLNSIARKHSPRREYFCKAWRWWGSEHVDFWGKTFQGESQQTNSPWCRYMWATAAGWVRKKVMAMWSERPCRDF